MMAKAKNMEDLKAKIRKVQGKNNGSDEEMDQPELPETPAQIPVQKSDKDQRSIEDLEAELAKKKKELAELAKKEKEEQPAEPIEDDEEPETDKPKDSGLSRVQQIALAIEEYQNDGKFRVEVISQMMIQNRTLADIAESLRKIVEGDKE